MGSINLKDFGNSIFVGEGSLNLEGAYRFYVQNSDSTFTELSEDDLILKPGETYTFARKDNAATHPFYIKDEEVIDLSNLSGDATEAGGITGNDLLQPKSATSLS